MLKLLMISKKITQENFLNESNYGPLLIAKEHTGRIAVMAEDSKF